MSGDDRLGTHFQNLLDCLIGGVGKVDQHAEAVHFAHHRAALVIQASPLRRRAAGVGEVVGPVVRRKLDDAQAKTVEVAQNPQVAVQIEASLQIEHRRYFAVFVDGIEVIIVRTDVDSSVRGDGWAGWCDVIGLETPEQMFVRGLL